ncbi:MAG TPA: glycosyltransferase family 39 protein [Flavitalea sp.]|nr:glycosyltransferase family 39 protein [Flavitalea sp.]
MQNLIPTRQFQFSFYATLFVLYGVLIFQCLYNRSVWNDEACLILTITNRHARDLFLPLDYLQIAPVLFLQIVKLTTVLFGDSEYALRLFPLLCSLAAIPLFYFFCLRFTGNRMLALFAIILLAISPGFIYYSSEVKQYCTDLFVTLLLYNTAFNNSDSLVKRRTLALSIVGVIAIFLSNISIIILVTIGLFFLYTSWKTKSIKREHWIPAVVWIIAFGINFLLFIKDHPSASYMREFWQMAFMPLDVFGSPFRDFMRRSMKIFSTLLFSFPGPYLFLITLLLFLGGLLAMLLEKRYLLLHLCVTPIAIHLGLSAIKMYPFEMRLLLYQAPFYILSIIFGLYWVVNKLISNPRSRIAITSICIALMAVKTFMNYPMTSDEIKHAIKYINSMHKPGESMYVAAGASPAVKYYRQRGFAKFDDLSLSLGKETFYDPRNFLKNIDDLHGRVWLLSSDVFPFRNNKEEEKAIATAIKERGKLVSQKDFIGSTVYLYDMH